MWAHANRRRTAAAILLLAACWLMLRPALPAQAAAAPAPKALTESAEWQRLVDFWHTMLDHSSDAIFNPTAFEELAPQLKQCDSDLAALADRGLLSLELAQDLRRIFHSRYEYIRYYHYTNQSQVTHTGFESARVTAQWVIELQLAVLRRAAASRSDAPLASAAQSNLEYELTFLHHLEEFETETQRRRGALKLQEEAGQTVDWQRFDRDCERRRALLLEAYRQRRLRRVNSVAALLPYLVALTSAQPSAPGETPPSSAPDWQQPDARLEH